MLPLAAVWSRRPSTAISSWSPSEIDPDALDPEDVDLLQDMIVAAVNEAIRGVSEVASKQMSSITGGLNIPGMPF